MIKKPLDSEHCHFPMKDINFLEDDQLLGLDRIELHHSALF